MGLPPRLTSFWIISSQISPNFLKFPFKFSISSQPGWQAGTIKATLIQPKKLFLQRMWQHRQLSVNLACGFHLRKRKKWKEIYNHFVLKFSDRWAGRTRFSRFCSLFISTSPFENTEVSNSLGIITLRLQQIQVNRHTCIIGLKIPKDIWISNI